MQTITWKEAFFCEKGLKGLRSDWKLNIPIEYINSTKKYFSALCILSIALGIILGIGFGYIYWGI